MRATSTTSTPATPRSVKLYADEWAALRRIAIQRGTTRHSLIASTIRKILTEQYTAHQKTPAA